MGGVDNEIRDFAEAASIVMGKKGLTAEGPVGPIGQLAIPGALGAGASYLHGGVSPEMALGALAATAGGSTIGAIANSPLLLSIANAIRQTRPQAFAPAVPATVAPLGGGSFARDITD
jgi:hypothetical protein